jgi:hypothetical protein
MLIESLDLPTNVDLPSRAGILSMRFSQCGDLYVIETVTSRPMVFPLPSKGPRPQATQQYTHVPTSLVKKRKSDVIASQSSEDIALKALRTSGNIRSGSQVVDEKRRTLTSLSTEKGMVLRTHTLSGREIGCQSIIKPPVDVTSANSATSIKLQENHVKLVLNSKPLASCEGDRHVSRHLPCIIDKDIQLLQDNDVSTTNFIESNE